MDAEPPSLHTSSSEIERARLAVILTTVAISVASSPCSRLLGWTASRAELRSERPTRARSSSTRVLISALS